MQCASIASPDVILVSCYSVCFVGACYGLGECFSVEGTGHRCYFFVFYRIFFGFFWFLQPHRFVNANALALPIQRLLKLAVVGFLNRFFYFLRLYVDDFVGLSYCLGISFDSGGGNLLTSVYF